jgi:hypothetical protein
MWLQTGILRSVQPIGKVFLENVGFKPYYGKGKNSSLR